MSGVRTWFRMRGSCGCSDPGVGSNVDDTPAVVVVVLVVVVAGASSGGGVNSSTSGRSGSAPGLPAPAAAALAAPFILGSPPPPRIGLSGDIPAPPVVPSPPPLKPRMIPSSTSRFFCSIADFLAPNSFQLTSSFSMADLLVDSSFSSPSTSARRAFSESCTADSADARFFSKADRRAAYTGGVGTGLAGSLSLAYSVSAVGIMVVAAAVALLRADCNGIRGWSSGGAEVEELEKRDPPRAGFLEDERDLSRSMPRCEYE